MRDFFSQTQTNKQTNKFFGKKQIKSNHDNLIGAGIHDRKRVFSTKHALTGKKFYATKSCSITISLLSLLFIFLPYVLTRTYLNITARKKSAKELKSTPIPPAAGCRPAAGW